MVVFEKVLDEIEGIRPFLSSRDISCSEVQSKILINSLAFLFSFLILKLYQMNIIEIYLRRFETVGLGLNIWHMNSQLCQD
jgi:hypothetical protein